MLKIRLIKTGPVTVLGRTLTAENRELEVDLSAFMNDLSVHREASTDPLYGELQSLMDNGTVACEINGAPVTDLDDLANVTAGSSLTFQDAGVLVGVRPIFNIIGAASVVDDPVGGRVTLTIASSTLSNNAPFNVTKAAASPGTGSQASRYDHKHDVSTAAAVALAPGDTNAEGTQTSLARSDHKHELPAFGSTLGTFCQGNDARLSDARTPTSHASTHRNGGGDEVATATAAANAIPKATGTGKLDIGWVPTGVTGTTVCVGNDARLSDARTPTSHALTHQHGGGDEVATATAAANAIPKAAGSGKLDIGWFPTGITGTTVCVGNDSRLSDARTPTAHKATHQHGGGDEVATATSSADAIPKATGTGKLDIGWIPTGATGTTVCVGNDSRLSDARTPTAHASTHVTGGSDVIANAVPGGASGLMSGADKTKLDGLSIPPIDSSDVPLLPTFFSGGAATQALAQTYIGALFNVPCKCSFVNAYLRLTGATAGAVVRVTIYQKADGMSGVTALVATGNVTLAGAGAQNITIPIVGSLTCGRCYILVGIDTATSATLRVHANPGFDVFSANVPTGKAPITFTTAITVNGTPPATFDPVTQATASTGTVAAVIRVGA